MKIIINTTTLSASGATQVATSFLEESKIITEHEYFVFLSSTVEKQIDKATFPENFTFYSFPSSPLYGLKGFKARKLLRNLEESISPDVVFSIFGPSWWSPKVPHLQGYAYPHYVYPESPLFHKLSWFQRMKIMLMKRIHLYFLNKNGDFFVSETPDVSRRLKEMLPEKKYFFSVGNTANSYFVAQITEQNHLLPKRKNGEFRLLALCTYHVHKNLEILNEVILKLNKKLPGNNFIFVLTIDEENFSTKFTEEAKHSIINMGRIDVAKCPQLYAECDALFLPTLLECFSANYPEAMIMKKPILTSDLSFATTVCGDAARYFNPIDAEDAALQILQLYKDPELREELIRNGLQQLKKFPTSRQRAERYLSICKEISS